MSKEQITIMVVDDYEGIREGVATLLQQEGYSLIVAANGKEAVNCMTDNVALIITDILMPEMDGLELVKHVQQSSPDMKFILISGGGRHLDNDTVPDFLAMSTRLTGVKTVLKKPFKPEQLIDMVSELLETADT